MPRLPRSSLPGLASVSPARHAVLVVVAVVATFRLEKERMGEGN